MKNDVYWEEGYRPNIQRRTKRISYSCSVCDHASQLPDENSLIIKEGVTFEKINFKKNQEKFWRVAGLILNVE